MDKQQIFKEMISEIIKKKFSLYGQVLITKISSTGTINISPSGEVIAINTDPKRALESILNVFKEISGNVGVTSAITALKVYSLKNAEVKADIDEVVSRF
ncbi:MAG: hypothetical protein QME63_02385 [Actinomycetota bacterium]|nr:hypothetical protein [Actinomycetota bacterium]